MLVCPVCSRPPSGSWPDVLCSYRCACGCLRLWSGPPQDVADFGLFGGSVRVRVLGGRGPELVCGGSDRPLPEDGPGLEDVIAEAVAGAVLLS